MVAFFHGFGGLFVDFSSKWWFVRGFFMDLVVFSWNFSRNGGLFVDFSLNWWFFVDSLSKWWFFRAFVFLLVDFSSKWWFFH